MGSGATRRRRHIMHTHAHLDDLLQPSPQRLQRGRLRGAEQARRLQQLRLDLVPRGAQAVLLGEVVRPQGAEVVVGEAVVQGQYQIYQRLAAARVREGPNRRRRKRRRRGGQAGHNLWGSRHGVRHAPRCRVTRHPEQASPVTPPQWPRTSCSMLALSFLSPPASLPGTR